MESGRVGGAPRPAGNLQHSRRITLAACLPLDFRACRSPIIHVGCVNSISSNTAAVVFHDSAAFRSPIEPTSFPPAVIQAPARDRPPALQMVPMALAGWLDRQERQAVAYLIEENRLLRRQL